MTLDGQLATITGDSQWISCEASRTLVHRQRNRVDGILTGAGTVLADNPRLTVRLPEGGRNPARIVIDGKLKTSIESMVYNQEAAGRRLLITADDIACERRNLFASHGMEILAVPRSGVHLDLDAVMDALGQCGMQSLLVEAGGKLNGALLRAGLVDRLMLFVAPLLLGGNDGRPLFSGNGAERLADALRLSDLQVTPVGDDWLFEGEVSRCSPD
jgi:diaminohydroxyphosphoribosylaminopyrimidine deaminase/5-amino-6-(5-phosphoribosylamino)uracil reductase